MRGVTLFEFLFGIPFLGMLAGVSVVAVAPLQARYEQAQVVAAKATRTELPQMASRSSLAAATVGHHSVTQVP